MDFRKWQYEEKQRAKESRRKATNISVKEMKYRPKIGQGDFDTKTRKVAEFLDDGHKVKITIMFRGRETHHPELGARILDTIASKVIEVGHVETQARLDGRNMTMVLAPEKKKQRKDATKPAAERPSVDGDEAPVAETPTAETPTAEAPVAEVPADDLPAPVESESA